MDDWTFIEEAKQRLQKKRQQDEPWKQRYEELEQKHKQLQAVNEQLKQLLKEAIAAPIEALEEPAKPKVFVLPRSPTNLKHQFIFDTVVDLFRRNPHITEMDVANLMHLRGAFFRSQHKPFDDVDVWEYLQNDTVLTQDYDLNFCPVDPEQGIFRRHAWLVYLRYPTL